MPDVITIAGSPSYPSRSSAALRYARAALEQQDLEVASIAVRELPPEDLVFGHLDSPAILRSATLIQQAQALVIATPIYKAAYTGALKAFLDLLPQNSLSGKVVLPIATGGSLAHLLALDYALKPVLAALGAQHILQGIYILDSQIRLVPGEAAQFDEAIELRLRRSVYELAGHVVGHRVLRAA
jgi:FMN reductase